VSGTLRAAFLTLSLHAGSAGAEPLLLGVVGADVYRNDMRDEPYLVLQLSRASTAAFDQFTRMRVGCLIDLWIDGRLVMTANVIEPITLGSLSVFAYGQDIHALRRSIDTASAAVVVDDSAQEPRCSGQPSSTPIRR
jgi:hypothetical protein